MRINTNLTALNTYGQYTKNNSKIASSVEKLSSGFAINSAADNAAGLAISEKMRAQIRGLEKAASNAQDAISLVQTAEGALNSADEILQRMRELSTQSSSDTNEDTIDRKALQDEFEQLQKELDEIATSTRFNGKNLIDGSYSTTKTSIGAQTDMATGSLSASVGKASAGIYNFSVSVVKTAAIEAENPDTLTVKQDTLPSGYVASATGTTSITDKSSLYNGNYTVTGVTYDGGGKMTLTATGGSDGDQKFTSTIDMNKLNTISDHTISAEFSDGTNSFAVKFTLDSKAAVNNKDFTTNNIDSGALQLFGQSFVDSKTTFSISGGQDYVAEGKAVQANLTGASSVALKAGDTSVTFDNGVTVNFDELTTADLDTVANYNTADTKTTFQPTSITSTINVNNTNSNVKSGTGSISAVTASSYAFTAAAAAAEAGATEITAQLTGAKGVTLTADDPSAISNWTVNADKSVSFDFQGTTYTSDALDDTTVALANNGVAQAAAFTVNFADKDGNTLTMTFGDTVDDTADFTQYTAVKAVAESGTAFASGDPAGAVAEYTVTASVQSATGGSTAYTAKMAAAGVAANGTTTLDFKFGTDASTAFSIELTNTTGAAITGATLAGTTAAGLQGAGAADGLLFEIGKADYAYTNTFGDTASAIEVTKTANAGLTFQVGANAGDEITLNMDRMDSEYLGVNGCDVSTREGASKAIDVVNDAINQVSSQRAYLGAIQNRLDYKIDNLNTSSENLTAAESAIRDVDMAKEMTAFTNANILQQAATAMLAQANSLPQNVLSLIGG